MVKKIHKILILLLSVLLCAAMTSCITFARAFMDALGTQSIDDREYVYGDENVIGITFEDGEMYAEWDYTDGVDYTLNVKTGDKTESYDKNDEGFTVGKTSLTDLGYTYWQDITLSLDATERSLIGKSTKTEKIPACIAEGHARATTGSLRRISCRAKAKKRIVNLIQRRHAPFFFDRFH